MHDLFWYLIVPFGWELTILGVLLMLSALMHRWRRLRRERQEINQRLAETIEQAHREAIEQSRKPEAADEEGFKCRKCRRTYHYKPRWSDICFNCWLELAHKMKKVA